MRLLLSFPVATLFLVVSATAQTKPNPSQDAQARNTIPQRYLVEFADPSDLRSASSAGASHIDVFYSNLRRSGIEASPLLNITSDIFDGVSFVTDDVTTIADLKARRDVLNVWPVARVPRPEPIVHSVSTRKLPAWNPHEFTGVLDLHKKGYLGKGAIVAVVDGGIDYNHPSLGGGFGPGFKVDGGRDIVGDLFNGEDFMPDPDPIDRTGHGTHVAGIIAADGDPGFVSVAPKATLRAYKVFGDLGLFTVTDALIAAFIAAYRDGADVINASVGGPSGWSETPWAVIASRLVNKGVFVTISAGNGGEAGPWYAGSGSSGTDVVAVASVESETLVAALAEVKYSYDIIEVPYLFRHGVVFDLDGTLPIYATSNDPTINDDACEVLDEDTPDLSGHLVLIRRGGCTFDIKERNAVQKGARFIWIYNTPDTPCIYPEIDFPQSKGCALIGQEIGEGILRQIAAGVRVSVTFSTRKLPTALNNTMNGGKISTFSSWGPTYEARIKPDISAPGGNIYSTFPLRLGRHAVLSGTSMSAPYIAGIAALYIGRAGGRGALGPAGILELRRRILAAGSLVNFNDGTTTDWSRLASVAQQGSGYINAKKVFYDTTISPGKLELNDTAHFEKCHYVNIRNSGKKTVLYAISHKPASTFNSFAPGKPDPQLFPPTFVGGTASVRFSVARVSVRPGTTKSFKVTFTPPKVKRKLLPVYSGKIVVSGSNGETLSIPYMGICGRLKNVKIWSTKAGQPIFSRDRGWLGEKLSGPANFTLVDIDRPAVMIHNNFGSAEIRADVVKADWHPHHWVYPPVEGKHGYLGSIMPAEAGPGYPLKYEPRIPFQFTKTAWSGLLTNGSVVAPGTYKIRMSALKVFGNPKRVSDWEIALSDYITIVGA